MGNCSNASKDDVKSGIPGVAAKPSVSAKSSQQEQLPNNFHSKYKLGSVLGQGSYSVVKIANRLADGKKVAVKILTRSKLKSEDESNLREEVRILMRLDHPNIVKALDFFEDDSYFYFVLEHLAGGELFDRILEKEIYNEYEGRILAVVVLKAIKFIHDQGLIHRDMKPENLLLVSKTDDTNIKVVDFGFAVQQTEGLVGQAGTPGYVAPEILEKKPQGKAVDMWSFGVILYMLLGGYHPFFEEGDSRQELFRKILTADYEFHADSWSMISDEAKDLIKCCLTTDPEKRITAEQALRHPWLFKPSQELTVVSLNQNLAVLKGYHAVGAAKAADIAIEAIRKLSGANISTIDVARKISGANLSSNIEVVRQLSGVALGKQSYSAKDQIMAMRKTSGVNLKSGSSNGSAPIAATVGSDTGATPLRKSISLGTTLNTGVGAPSGVHYVNNVNGNNAIDSEHISLHRRKDDRITVNKMANLK